MRAALCWGRFPGPPPRAWSADTAWCWRGMASRLSGKVRTCMAEDGPRRGRGRFVTRLQRIVGLCCVGSGIAASGEAHATPVQKGAISAL